MEVLVSLQMYAHVHLDGQAQHAQLVIIYSPSCFTVSHLSRFAFILSHLLMWVQLLACNYLHYNADFLMNV